MVVDPFTITAGVTSAIAIASLFYARNRARVVRGQNLYIKWQDQRIDQLTADNALYLDRETAAQEQRVAASARAAEINRKRAAERRQASREITVAALASTSIPPRSEVVAGVRVTRPRRSSGAGQVAAKQRG